LEATELVLAEIEHLVSKYREFIVYDEAQCYLEFIEDFYFLLTLTSPHLPFSQ
jgi:hypothetical protein